MSHPRFSLHTVVLILALAALLIVGLTLVVVAQDLDDRDTSIAQGPEVRDVPFSPDKVTVVEEVELLPDPSATSSMTYYRFLAANTFVPHDDDMTYFYDGGGCVYRTGGNRFASHSLELPQGAEITYLSIYFYDNDDHNVGAYLYGYDGSGGHSEIAQAFSSGTPGQSAAGSGPFSYFVNNGTTALNLTLDYGFAGDENLRICGVRVRYEYTISITDLPLILNGFGP